MTATALAASGQVQCNFAGVALNGETKIAAGSDITAPNGQRVPGSILYVDEAGGKTNYLPIRTISELLGGRPHAQCCSRAPSLRLAQGGR